ncbi:hypothetical protein AGMMS49965_17370 [Bacteroidia bacterium]|nr:hypothetical protein AGMMS49965_17370 [Bacteroidia bacterium]
MKKQILIALLACSFASIDAQDDFQKYVQEQKAAFNRYSADAQADFNNYRDSLNREFANYLAEKWKNFPLTKKEPPINNPIPTPPVYNPDAPKPEPVKIPVVVQPEPVKPQPQPQPDRTPPPAPQPKPQPATPPPTISTNFFGTQVAFPRFSKPVPVLSGVAETEVAAYWSALSKLPYDTWTSEIQRIKSDLNLNDWGMYLLINQLFEVYAPNGKENEKVIFTVFTLNQLGYRAKIGRSQNELLPLAAFQSNVFNTSFFSYGNEANIKYSVVNPQHKNLASLQTCSVNYAGATKNLDMSIRENPRLAAATATKMLNDKKNNYKIEYNKNLVKYYDTYPCVDFSVYAEAALDPILMNSVRSQLVPQIQNKSQEEAVNILLHFVQHAFEYKTDAAQFGYEKWFFAEETIASAYSDCEDRSILFAQLVRTLLGMKVVLINYPGVHLATAVKFDNPATNGDNITVEGQKYLICDPTYIGANLGTMMPNLKSTAVEVIRLK